MHFREQTAAVFAKHFRGYTTTVFFRHCKKR